MNASQALCRFKNNSRRFAPTIGSIRLFPALYIIFPTNFSACSAKTMSHHQSNIEIYSSLETVVFRALPGKRLIIDLPSVGCPVNSPRQPLRVISNPIEQIHNIIIQIVDGFNIASILSK